MQLENVYDRMWKKFAELERGLELVWRYPPRPTKAPSRARPLKSWKVWDHAHPAALKKNSRNWFYTEFVFPRRMAGLPLDGEQGYIYIGTWCPFTLWLDGEELFREEHAWFATGPIADPVVHRIEPGRPYRIAACFEPTEVPYNFNPLSVAVRPFPCVQVQVDLLAAMSELRIAEGFARTARERETVSRAADNLDLDALEGDRWPEFLASVEAMEAALKPFETRARGMTVHLIGHTHIDMNWMWTWEDTVHCIRRDYRAVLDLMETHPEVTFSLSQIPTYDVIRKGDPDLFAKVRRRIREGRWENVAGTWVEGDLNMADGEAIARHMLYAADWSAKHLGRKASVFWAPDTFGHPANMPQLAALGEFDAYFHWRCNPGGQDNWPARVWEGADGGKILAISSCYAGGLQPGFNMAMALHNVVHYQKFGLRNAHHVWGCGDHGGALARHHLAMLERYRSRPLMPRFRFSTMRQLREALLTEKKKLPRNSGETFSLFEGCFTTHSLIKSCNRRCEGALLVAEAMTALAGLDRRDPLRRAWKDALFNQFHDLLDGCSVADSYQDSLARGERAIRTAEKLTAEATARLVKPDRSGPALALLNPLGFERTEIAAASLPRSAGSLIDAEGTRTPVQQSGGKALFFARNVPAFGRKMYCIESGGSAPTVEIREDGSYFTIQTPLYRAMLGKDSGAICSFFDRELGRELVGYGTPRHLQHVPASRADMALNVFQVIDEADNSMSAWLMNDTLRQENLMRGAEVRFVETGPVFARFLVRHSFRSSRIEEEILFFRDLARVDFAAVVDWREKGSPERGIPQLKVSFAASMRAARSHSEGPFALNERPADGLEQPTQKWADLTGDEFGFTLYNDSRYGFDALGSRLRLTLLRNAYSPDPDSDNGIHTARFAFEPHGRKVPHASLVRAGMAYNRPLIAARTKEAVRDCGDQFAIAGADSIVCSGMRLAEHSGGITIRLFETSGKHCRARVFLGRGIRSAGEVNFLENPIGRSLPVSGGTVQVRFRPYEVKTLLATRRGRR